VLGDPFQGYLDGAGYGPVPIGETTAVLVVADDHMMTANSLPEVPNARLLSFHSEMRDRLSEDQRRTGAHCRIRDADAICGRAKSDLLLHNFLQLPQHLRIGFGALQLCRSVSRDPAARLAWRPARRLVVAAIPALGFLMRGALI
jgi:hypothetical protein